MSDGILIGIDAGTSVIKSVAFTVKGEQIAAAALPNLYHTFPDGGAEQDMARTWADTAATLKELSEKIPNLRDRVIAISVTGQGDGMWLIDKAGEMGGRLRGAMLLATFAGDVNRSNPQNRVQIPLITSGLMARLVRVDAFAASLAKSLLGRSKPAAAVRALTNNFRRANLRSLVPMLRAFVREDRYGDLVGVSMPCAIVVGTLDKTTPPFHTDKLHAGIRGSRVVRVAERGHLLNWEAPDVIIDEVVKLAG